MLLNAWPMLAWHCISSLSIALFATAHQSPIDHSLGHYAFDIGGPSNMQPPKVRKPPYVASHIPCPGTQNPSNLLHPKDTLCGDLNKGYVPLSPFNHLIENQPYPFELIKNKTLTFLARSLPFLQRDMVNIPKVFRMPVHGIPNMSRTKRATNPGLSKLEAIEIEPSVGRSGSGSRLRTLGRVLQALDSARSAESTSESESSDSTNNSTQVVSDNHASIGVDKKSKGSEFSDSERGNMTDSKTKGCDASDGILCQVMQLVASSNSPSASSTSNTGSSGALLNTIAQTLQVMNSANSLSGIAQLLTAPIDGNKTGDPSHTGASQGGKPLLAQVIQAIGALSANSASASGSGATGGNTSPYNPLSAIFDYFSGSGAAHLLPARRKKPMDLEDLFTSFSSPSSERTSSASGINTVSPVAEPIQLGQTPPTACPSIEEYVAPVYARNYQGLWKYVVQIPHEGYFTQTVQKTSCMKGKCDYLDGYCKESSRWVSLLVAEAYYPDAKFSPIRQPTSTGPRTSTLSSSPSSPSSSSSTSSSLHKPFMSSVNSINAPFLSNSAVTSQALHQALAQPSLSVYQSPNNALKYSFPSVNNALPGDYNHYDNLFSRRASVPSTSAAKQPKFASSLRYKLATSQPSAAAATSWPTYSPQQVQQMWQQYHQALGLVQPLKPAVRSSFDYHTQPQSHQHRLQPQSQSSSHHHPSSSNGGLIASLFSSTGATSTSPATFTNRWFGSGPSSRSSEARPRSFQGDLHPHHHHHRSVSSADQIVSRSGATYVGEEEPETTSSNSNEGRSVASGLSVAGETSLTGTINSAAQSVPSSSVSSSSDLQPDHNVSGSVSSVTSNLGEQNDEECDGYDANGCYVIRVYYDWFLVPGSCKCWKRTSSGSFDTLKRIFIG